MITKGCFKIQRKLDTDASLKAHNKKHFNKEHSAKTSENDILH